MGGVHIVFLLPVMLGFLPFLLFQVGLCFLIPLFCNYFSSVVNIRYRPNSSISIELSITSTALSYISLATTPAAKSTSMLGYWVEGLYIEGTD